MDHLQKARDILPSLPLSRHHGDLRAQYVLPMHVKSRRNPLPHANPLREVLHGILRLHKQPANPLQPRRAGYLLHYTGNPTTGEHLVGPQQVHVPPASRPHPPASLLTLTAGLPLVLYYDVKSLHRSILQSSTTLITILSFQILFKPTNIVSRNEFLAPSTDSGSSIYRPCLLLLDNYCSCRR